MLPESLQNHQVCTGCEQLRWPGVAWWERLRKGEVNEDYRADCSAMATSPVTAPMRSHQMEPTILAQASTNFPVKGRSMASSSARSWPSYALHIIHVMDNMQG